MNKSYLWKFQFWVQVLYFFNWNPTKVNTLELNNTLTVHTHLDGNQLKILGATIFWKNLNCGGLCLFTITVGLLGDWAHLIFAFARGVCNLPQVDCLSNNILFA